MDKQKYYVNLASQQISTVRFENNDSYVIYASEEEVRNLRQKLNHMHEGDMNAFFRAHVPIMPYHNDRGNDHYDSGMSEAFQIIYDLGDEKTKEHLTDIGVLDKKGY
ncbi:hydrolase [Virgibacillus halophilus]|uniref:hydrolase n=1 Tax=Tigheibacillus halophilus TaxID=361280 RepID=UPI00362A3FAA